MHPKSCAYAHVSRRVGMIAIDEPQTEICNCAALRQAARHVTQFYDQHLAAAGLRTTQFSILAKLRSFGPLTINALAEKLVMDRTTLSRNIQPLRRENLVTVRPGRVDRRTKELHLTEIGRARVRAAAKGWAQAQARFEAAFGKDRALDLRRLMRDVVASDFDADAAQT
jgi:DNA-binding MarR family transcriptional regulator